MSQTTPNLGLMRRGPLSYERDSNGTASFDCDLNADLLDSAVGALQQISQIDGGTF